MKKEENFSNNSSEKKTNTNGFKKYIKPVPIAILIAFILIIVLATNLIQKHQLKTQFEEDYLGKAQLNEEQIFHVSKIFYYSSASADTNSTNQPQWDLDLNQFTDIAIYLNTDRSSGTTEENTIKKMSIYDINITNNEDDNADLYFKDLTKFGTSTYSEENRIDGSLNYEIINSYEMDYSKPQIYTGVNNPIALEFVRKDVKKNYIIKDLTTPLIFNGTILKQANVSKDNLTTTVSFKIEIVNNLDQEFIANVYLDIPLEEEKSIYEDGYCTKEILNPDISFLRVK